MIMNQAQKAQANLDRAWNLLLGFFSLFVAMAVPEMAFATNNIGTVLCNVVGWMTGTVGSGIATVAIIVVGIGALMGKVSWGMAIIVGVGVAIIFGSASVVDSLNAGGEGC